MIFVFDLDDTICDTDSYSEKYISDFFKTHNLPYKKIADVVRFAESKFSWDKDTANVWYKTYGDDMMSKFPAKPNAVKCINKLYDMGHTIIIATARAGDWHTNPKEVTIQWLESVGLKYHKLHIGRVDKEKICEEENADVFIDDDIDIVTRVASFFYSKNNGGIALLSTTAYNKKLKTPNYAVRMLDFYDFEDRFVKANT